MADGINHADLMQMTERLEGSFQREVDRLSKQLDKQETRADEDRAVISKHSEDIRVLQHDVRDIKNVRHGREGSGPVDVSAMAVAQPTLTPAQRKAFIAGIVATAMALAGVAQGAAEVLAEILKRLKS